MVQNKLIRFVLSLPPRTHVGYNEFKKIGWLPVADRVQQICLSHIFKIYNKTAPSYLCKEFRLACTLHSHNTRSSSKGLIVPTVGTHGKKTFSYNSTKFWNNLPNDTKNVDKIDNFKKKVRINLFNELERKDTSQYVYY